MDTASPDDLQVHQSSSLREAMSAIQRSGRGIVAIHDDHFHIVGILTDGDIRKLLLKDVSIDEVVTDYMVRDFVSAPLGVSKEQILKLLDSRIRSVPILTPEGLLNSIAGSGYTAEQNESFSRAKAPVRISLAGGGTDFTNHFIEFGGVSLTTTIAIHSRCTLRRRIDNKIQIFSDIETKPTEPVALDELAYDGTLDLIKAGIKVMRPEFGFDLWVESEVPPASGLGGSASVLASVIGCINEFCEDPLDDYSIAEHAFEAERIELRIKGGWQDQYSTVFGGFNFIDFNETHNTVTPLRLPKQAIQELEERFILCFTQRKHLGEAVQSQNYQPRAEVISHYKEIETIAREMNTHLLRGNLSEFGKMLDTTWQLKKRLNKNVTSDDLDRIYQLALENGAEGGRLLGTGGGGFFIFFTRPFERQNLFRVLSEQGLSCQSVIIDDKGLQSWKTRV